MSPQAVHGVTIPTRGRKQPEVPGFWLTTSYMFRPVNVYNNNAPIGSLSAAVIKDAVFIV